jgi:hypothetical protein
VGSPFGARKTWPTLVNRAAEIAPFINLAVVIIVISITGFYEIRSAIVTMAPTVFSMDDHLRISTTRQWYDTEHGQHGHDSPNHFIHSMHGQASGPVTMSSR